MKKRVWGCLIILAGLVGLLFLVSFILQKVGLLPAIDIYEIDMRGAAIPTHWRCDWCKNAPDANWEYEEWIVTEENYKKITVVFPLTPYDKTKAFQWVDYNHDYVVEMVIIDFKNPLEAKINFPLLDPKGWAKKTHMNFVYYPEKMVPPDWDWVNPYADKEAVRCGGGDQDHCTGWFYQARYGQYYQFIYFWYDSGYKEFEEFVKALTEEFHKYLE